MVSCPCALVISIPLSFFCGIGAASKSGVLIKGSSYIEALSKIDTIVFDKTGTLTKGVFEVQKIEYQNITKEEFLKYAVYAEYFSTHPIAESLKKLYKEPIKEKEITDTKEISGRGIFTKIDQQEILIGNEQLMKENEISFSPVKDLGIVLYLSKNKQ